MDTDEESNISDEEVQAEEQEVEKKEVEKKGESTADEEDKEIPQKEIPGRKLQHFVYRPHVAFYPFGWNGRYFFKESRHHEVYGLIIFVRKGVCYFLTQLGQFEYKPKFLKAVNEDYENHNKQLIGCWARFNVDTNDGKICSVPQFANSPLHTRVFDNRNETWTLLIYDYVNVERDNIVFSKFLGTIPNEDVNLINNRTNALWRACNVEYEITVGFKKSLLHYSTKVVKFHGSVEVHFGLPKILSYRPGNDDNCSYMKTLFQRAFQSPEELEREKQEEAQIKREKLKQRDLQFMAPESSNQNIKNEKLDPVQSMIDSGVPISIRSRNKNSSLSSNNAMQNTVPQNNVSAPPKTTNETVPQNAASFSKTPIVQNVVPRAQQIPPAMQNSRPNVANVARGTVVDFNQQPTTSSLTNVPNPTSAKPSERRTILFTYAAFGFPLELATQYLLQNHNVAIHCAEPHTKQQIDKLVQRHKSDRIQVIEGQLSKNFTAVFVKKLFQKFGKIDVVFHFASALRKVNGQNEPYEELRYLFKENVRPMIYIADALKKHMPIAGIKYPKFIAVAPIFNPDAIQKQLLPNLKTSLAYLQLAADEIGQNPVGDQYIMTKFIGLEDFQDLDFSQPTTIINQVCNKLADQEIKLSF